MTKNEGQADFKKIVKQWLKDHSLDYRWIAEQCGVSEITVRNWMSQKNIPPLKQQLLEKVMVQMPSTAVASQGAENSGIKVNTSLALTIHLSPEIYTGLVNKAEKQGTTIESMVEQAIMRVVNDTETAPIGMLRNRKIILPS